MASGCIESIVINGRRFTTDAEDSCEITYDGFENEVKPNGDGTMRIVKSRHRLRTVPAHRYALPYPACQAQD